MIVVISGNTLEFEQYCQEHGLTRKDAAEIRQGYQLQYYKGCDFVKVGQYWLNEAYASPEFTEMEREHDLRVYESQHGA